ncbi:uncharacterized protein LOC132064784 [Lycium ferocissimum]|uniref:uncharacterized protein LOC132064784 n=1 Tax=Lycium ferocissimum TaxID=112874 RepID=UPI0028149AB1|nr:uncharacterized protein LOC132064784 [Lycium ferocissimum]
MAVSSNRSPSPLTARPVLPNPRTSENTNSTPRRSFNGNPFSRPSVLSIHRGLNPVTPFNSPADSAKRVSNSGKEGLVFVEDKENELKAAKLRSPAKGSKNFMSPTISASSKIAQSPKKKILVERNDPVRTSITLSDGKATFFSQEHNNNNQNSDNIKSLEGTENVMMEPKETVHPVTKPQKKVTFLEVPSNYNNDPESHSDTVTMDSDLSNDVIAPLDADPSLPPYNPRTNYLSPRPQFLHYKPNPRIEVLLNKEKGLDVGEPKSLEDSFLSELLSDNFSDIDGSESSLTEDSLKESEGSSSEEVIVYKEEEEEPKVSEPVIPVAEDISEAKMTAKPRSFKTISKFFSLLLVLMIGFVSFSITDSPILAATPGSIDLRFSNLSIPSDIPILAKANSHFKQVSGEAISYFSKLIYDIGRIDYAQKPLKFMNLTDLEESSSIYHGYISSEELDKVLEPIELDEDEESETEPDEEEVQMEGDLDDEVEIEGARELEIEEISSIQLAEVNEVEIEGAHELEIEEVSAIQLTEVNEADSLEKDLGQGQHDLVETEEVSVVLAKENESDSSERDLDQGLTTSDVELELAESKSAIADNSISTDVVVIESVNDNPESLVKYDSAVEDAQPLEMLDRHDGDNVGAYQILGISSLVLGVLAATVLYVKSRSDKTLHPLAAHADQVSSKKFDKHSSQNWPTEVDVAGESCPSEMSSFQISSSYSKKYPKSENDEAQSIEKKPRKSNRRESLATSEFSMGSFTTYERIHASGGEEVITPVRRSSRIRSHVISP